jgi:hypothetical protein
MEDTLPAKSSLRKATIFPAYYEMSFTIGDTGLPAPTLWSVQLCKSSSLVPKDWGRLKLGKVPDSQKLNITSEINYALAQGLPSPGREQPMPLPTHWLLDGNHLVPPFP